MQEGKFRGLKGMFLFAQVFKIICILVETPPVKIPHFLSVKMRKYLLTFIMDITFEKLLHMYVEVCNSVK